MLNIIKAAALTTGAAAASFLIAAAPAAAQASAEPPSYALKPATVIQGRIASIPGKYTIEVNDNNGYVDNVSLHDGTIINPTGITLQPGFPVTIYGEPNGSTFEANQIDTPYRYVAGYYPGPYWGAYPYYGPVVGLNFGFGFGFHGGRWR
jgi:hypothetical protein